LSSKTYIQLADICHVCQNLLLVLAVNHSAVYYYIYFRFDIEVVQ